ncbi:YqcI/YcgG family protein [Tamlana sp. s12]|uniref:guanitoxin biosynthesis heme-dependent pre-guanitoxin N-hydroxylase GntA n=1 Tax=Tamlana sp. s12 TaxID=1630406 RepID=UPI0007FD9883|nr:guanitoxin biosynthesis heme-dependent pre-guanitoxin N-hydroxylase GntA [Tamlana sp. s12]OBQ52904.1 hypothetical protein VQ01_13235 [Tamlana sp. s12]QQY81068.1 YqcI/YcgG family protein [Tamlana sp. s12]
MGTLNKYTILETKRIETEFKNFILNKEHPCVMAKAVFSKSAHHIRIYESMDDKSCASTLLSDLEHYIRQYNFNSNTFESFIAVFPSAEFSTEIAFETQLWTLLQQLHDLDDTDWNPLVSKNPESPKFSFSLKGKAFYIIGLHPNSSRKARQSPYPALVFNLHSQFEKLRDMGAYDQIKQRIRNRDKEWQGHINPVLKDFGQESETKQYSGRAVDKDWICPFQSKH